MSWLEICYVFCIGFGLGWVMYDIFGIMRRFVKDCLVLMLKKE